MGKGRRRIKSKSKQHNSSMFGISKMLVLPAIVIITALIACNYYLNNGSKIQQTAQNDVTITPTPTISPWDTPIKSWKIYKTNKYSFKYPPSMQIYFPYGGPEPNALTGKYDAVEVIIAQDGFTGLDIKIEPTSQQMTAIDWAIAHQARTAANKQFDVPIESFTFNGIPAATQTLTSGMLLGKQLYYPLGNNIIWVSLGGPQYGPRYQINETLLHLKEIDLKVE